LIYRELWKGAINVPVSDDASVPTSPPDLSVFGLPASVSRPEDFDDAYVTPPPWDIGHPQPALIAVAEAGKVRGHVLDIGCGTGEHALMAARLGLVATGVDTSATAIALAKRKAAERLLQAQFLVWNALDLAALGKRFDTVLDCGMFHLLDDGDRVRFAASLRGVVPIGGRYFMLCFSDRMPGNVGPRRVSPDEIRSTFSDGWRVDAIDEATIEILAPSPIPAWLAAIARV
jgi:SAM-dependent methyltransferase